MMPASGRKTMSLAVLLLLMATAVHGYDTLPMQVLRDPVSDIGDGFGARLAMSGDWLAVVAQRDGSYVSAHGAEHRDVFMFHRQPSGNWTYTEKIARPGSATAFTWGSMIGLHHDRSAAQHARLAISYASSNSVIRVYDLDPSTGYTTWRTHGEYSSTDAVNESDDLVIRADFMIYGNIYPVGIVHIVRYNQGMWQQHTNVTGAAPYGWFSSSFDINADETRLVVGAPNDDTYGIDNGLVHVFDKRNGVWTETASFTSSFPDTDMSCGRSVQVSEDGNTIAFLCPEAGSNGFIEIAHYDSGSGNWTVDDRVSSAGTGSGINRIRMVQGVIAAGAPSLPPPPDSGGAFTWQQNTTLPVWQQQVLRVQDPQSWQQTGADIAMTDSVLAIGGHGNSAFPVQPGLVALFPATVGLKDDDIDERGNSPGLSTGAIIGIVVAASVFVGAAVLLVKRRSSAKPSNAAV